jgi:hypothetical protein
MSVTQRYKTVHSSARDWFVLVAGTLFMCSGPILDAFGLLRG